MSHLERLVAPASIAIAGLSADHDKHGRRVLGHLQRMGYGGSVYGVNPGLPEVAGVEMVASLRDLPTPPDLVVCAVPAPAAVQVVETSAGVGAAIVFAGGFGESGGTGLALEADLRAVARETGTRLLGPNSGGVIRPSRGLAASFLTCLDRATHQIRTGRVGLVTQSGGIGSYIHNLAAERGGGLAISVSTGNEVDIKLGEALGAVAVVDEVDVLLVILETVRDGAVFIDAVRRCSDMGKQVVACRIGTGELSKKMMASHTGAMAVPGRVLDGVLDSLGVSVAETPEEGYEMARAVADLGRVGSKLGVVTHSGGLAILLADLAERSGVELPAPGEGLGVALAPLLDHGAVANPLDMGGIIGGPGRFAEVVAGFAGSGEYDAVLAVSSAHPPAHTMERVDGLLAVTSGVPVVHLWMAGDQGVNGLHRLRAGGAVTVTEPRAAMRALGAAMSERPSRIRPEPITAPCEDWGLPYLEQRLATSREDAVSAASSLGYPVVIKLIATEVDHKTELGGVVLDVRNDDEVRAAFAGVVAGARDTGHEVSGVTVSRYRPGIETIVGAHVDPVLGPLVSVGSGGTMAEAIGDVTFAAAPVTTSEALAMIDSLHVRPILDGVRGRPAADVDALAGIVEVVSRGIAGLRYAEFEINPLIWDGSWFAVDVLAVPSPSIPE